jgi:hypothetical protein
MSLQPKVTYNKTISLNRDLFERWTIYAALHEGHASFNGLVIRHLEEILPQLSPMDDENA